MIHEQNVYKSTKKIGKYEEKLIHSLIRFFKSKGYVTIPHSRFNIAWGSILSDVDLLLIKDNLLTYIEVKSSRDNFAKAAEQVDRVKDYVDYAYVATDKNVKKPELGKVGFIHILGEDVKVIEKAKRFSQNPRFLSVATLKKKCLLKFFMGQSFIFKQISKYELAQNVYLRKICTRDVIREIVVCGELCNSSCPIMDKKSSTHNY